MLLSTRFYRDNRMVPLGIMLCATILFFYHLDLDRHSIPSENSTSPPEPYVGVHLSDPTVSNHADSPSSSSSSFPAYSSPAVPSTDYSQYESLRPDEIVLLFKTGASIIWKRLPIHLVTSLAPERIDPSNTVIYSDAPDAIGSREIIDVLANMTSETVRKSNSFRPYLQQQDYDHRQAYVESGDSSGPIGGWRLDKYKFLPLIQHAGETKPDAKWYIYMEDDTYIFLHNLLRHLARFDWRDPWYMGNLAYKHGDYFAHGGAGFTLSRGAWEQSFGTDRDIVDKFEEFTEEHGCGDHVLGHVLKAYGVNFGESEKEQFTFGFNAEPHWATPFSRSSWCKPIYSWHHTHVKDVARFYQLERSWDIRKKGSMTYRDIYDALVAPYLRSRIDWWDNRSSRFAVTSGNAKADLYVPDTVKSKNAWLTSWQSAEACEAACVSWTDCVQWSFYEDRCKMDDQITLGTGYPVGDFRRQTALMTTSGWLPKRLESWICDE